MSLKLILLWTLSMALIHRVLPKCAYSQPPEGLPYPYDGDSFAINYTMQACKQYIGHQVCCNQHNARLTRDNLKQLDGALMSASGGCDICSINSKRFWCQYACSPRQADFLKVSKSYYWYPDPQRPGKQILAQETNLTVHADTACTIFESCKRVPFVASVSALGTPAGFLNFQGHNAVDNALQYINVFFSYNKSQSLYFGNDTQLEQTKEATACNYKGKTLHEFVVEEECSCNTCQLACDNSKGFIYTQPSVFQGFNWKLVLGVYGFVAIVTIPLTYYRAWRLKNKEE